MKQSTRARRLKTLAIKKRKWHVEIARAGKHVVLLESEEITLREGCTHRDDLYKPVLDTNGIDTWCSVCGATNTNSVLAVAGLMPGLAKARPRPQLVRSDPTIRAQAQSPLAATRR